MLSTAFPFLLAVAALVAAQVAAARAARGAGLPDLSRAFVGR